MALRLKPSINWLLAFIPISLALEYAHVPAPVLFFSAALAILPIARLIVLSTEQLATRTGDAIGGLLNATFGNAPELIIALVALKAGFYDMVRASIIGAILANLMLATGAAFFLGGLRYHTQEYNASAARLYSSMMLISAVSLGVPSAFNRFFSPGGTIHEEKLVNLGTAFVLLAAYGLYLVFLLKTHPDYFKSVAPGHDEHEHGEMSWSPARAVASLIGASLLAAWMSEILVGAAEGTGQGIGHVRGFHRHRVSGGDRRCRRKRVGHCDGAQEQIGPHDWHRDGQQHSDCAVRGAGPCTIERRDCPSPTRALVQPG